MGCIGVFVVAFIIAYIPNACVYRPYVARRFMFSHSVTSLLGNFMIILEDHLFMLHVSSLDFEEWELAKSFIYEVSLPSMKISY